MLVIQAESRGIPLLREVRKTQVDILVSTKPPLKVRAMCHLLKSRSGTLGHRVTVLALLSFFLVALLAGADGAAAPRRPHVAKPAAKSGQVKTPGRLRTSASPKRVPRRAVAKLTKGARPIGALLRGQRGRKSSRSAINSSKVADAARSLSRMKVRRVSPGAMVKLVRTRSVAARLAGQSKTGAKRSKVPKSIREYSIGEGRFRKIVEVRPGKGPGMSRAEYVRIKNRQGKTIRTYKWSFDRANRFQHRKPTTGGPEGRVK